MLIYLENMISLSDFDLLVKFSPHAVNPQFASAELRSRVDTSAHIKQDVGFIGLVESIGPNTSIESGVRIGDGVLLCGDVTVERGAVLEDGVRVDGGELSIGEGAFMGKESSVDTPTRTIGHPYARRIFDNTIVGPGVILPSEVQIGPRAIVPTSDTVG